MLPAFVICDLCDFLSDVSWEEIQPRLALEYCLQSFFKLHLNGKLSWQDGGVQLVLNWLLSDIDPGWQEQVAVRLHVTTDS